MTEKKEKNYTMVSITLKTRELLKKIQRGMNPEPSFIRIMEFVVMDYVKRMEGKGE
jgi:hypothetical protein